MYDSLLTPFRIKSLALNNRVVSTAHAPAYAENGLPGERYQLYHEEKAKGGIGLTMFGGSSPISADSPASFGQINVSNDAVVPYFKAFSKLCFLLQLCFITIMRLGTSVRRRSVHEKKISWD